MKLKRISSSMLGLLVATSLVPAQAEPRKAQEPQAKEASVKAEPAIQLAFTVTGLTQENLPKVTESLKGLAVDTYACDMCKVEQATAGKCPGCQGDLMAKKHACFQSVMPSADDSTVKLTLDPAAPVRFSEIEKALAKNTVKIDASRFPIPGKAHLVFRDGTAELAPAIEKAVKDAKLFDEVRASFDAATKEIHVMVRAGPAAPTRAKLTASLESAGVKLPLADLVWGHKMMKKPAG